MVTIAALAFLAGGLALIVGVILLVVGAFEPNRKLKKIGAFVVLGGAFSLLVSFTLCSNTHI